MAVQFSPEVQLFLSLVVQAVIPVLVSALIGVVTVLASGAVVWVKANVSQAQLKQAKSVVDFLVSAAEQSGLTGALEADGSAKKQWVIEQVTQHLKDLGLNKLAEDVTLIENLIESSVYDLKNIKLPPLIEAVELTPVQPPVSDPLG